MSNASASPAFSACALPSNPHGASLGVGYVKDDNVNNIVIVPLHRNRICRNKHRYIIHNIKIAPRPHR